MLHENNSELNELEREVNGELLNKFSNDIKGYQMPAHLVAAEFGEVNVFREQLASNSTTTECRVSLTIAMEPQGRFAEGWRTGLALDASASMKRAYGRKVEARVDPELLTDYIKQGRLRAYMEDGEPTRKIEREAFAEIQRRGYEINYTENILQPLVQNFTSYLAGSLDGTGKTSLIYWGCGKGDEIQALGEFDALGCQDLAITGPASFKLGKTTKLLPAIAYFVDQYRRSPRGIYIFLTDGRIDDLEQVKIYTKELALEIAVGKRNYLKLILIGIGNDIDRYQLQELDDFDTGLDIDLWDYKIASEMHNLTQIFAEVVNDNQIIAASGSIYDDAGNCVKSYANGLPAKVDFVMRDDSQWFELEVNNRRIRQSIIFSDVAIAPLAKKKLFDFEIKARENRNQVLRSSFADQSDQSDHQQSQQTAEMNSPLSPWWKWLSALLIGAAFLGTMIAFAILIKQSDDNKLQDIANFENTRKVDLNPKATPNKSASQPITNLDQSNLNKPDKIVNNNSSNSSSKNSGNSAKILSIPQNKKAVNPATTTSNDLQPNKSNRSANSLTINSENNFLKTIGDLIEKTSSNTVKSSASNPANNNRDRRNISTSILPITNPDLEVTIFFPSDEVQLMPTEESKIDNFWTKIQGRRGIIQVSGHADTTGDYAYNLDLSQSRANEVVKLLRDRGLDDNYKITFEALSWLQPLRKNSTAIDNAFNRRVVLQFKEQLKEQLKEQR
jgi:outer membrane protein OmpA-like peptidoglycan-associated protein